MTVTSLAAAVAASENSLWLDVVGDVYRQAHAKRGLDVCEIVPVASHLQPESVDYLVTLASPETGSGFQEYCELKTERHCFGRITVEDWSVYERGIEGWPWKLTEINHQRLCTIWRDGTVFFPYLNDYKNWLADNRESLLAKVGTHPDYKRITAKSVGFSGKAYTSLAFTVPLTELREAFGRHCWYRLEGVSHSLARSGIDEITKGLSK